MLVDFLQFDFLRRALLAGVLLASVAPLVGMFLVARRFSLLSDTLAHVSLFGVALGLFFGFSPLLSALVVAVVAALGMERLRGYSHLFGESVLALFLSGSLALAVILMSLSHGLGPSLTSYLFGSLSTVTTSDLWLIGIFSLFIAVFILVSYRKLFLMALDEELAQASGVPVARLNRIFLVLVAVAVALLSRVVGALLVGALLVIPVLSAFQFRRSFAVTLVIAEGISLVSVIAGLFAAYAFGTPAGGTIVLSALVFFAISLLLGRR